MDLFGWKDNNEDSTSARDTSLSGQVAQQWKLRMMARGTAVKEIAISRLRRLLARNQSISCPDVQIVDTVLCYEASRKKSTPRWRGPS